MKFCPKCGTRLRSSAKDPRLLLICEGCGYVEPPTSGATRREPKFGYRPWQPKVIERIVDSINAGRKVILDAPTGSGKTLIALKVAEKLLKDERSIKRTYVVVRTINEMVPYERDISRFAQGLQYKYLLGKRRSCPFYANGDDTASALCEACLGADPPRMTVDSSVVAQDLRKGLYFLETKYVKAISESRRNVVRNGICLDQSMKDIPAAVHLVSSIRRSRKQGRILTRK